jgi:hypothetical protein
MTDAAPKKRSWWKIGCLVVLGLFGVLVIISLIGVAVMTPEERARIAAEQEARDAKDAAMTEARRAADLAGVRKAFEKLGLPCDVAQLQVGDGLSKIGTGDRVALARAVSGMEDRCSQAWQGVDDIALPDGLTDVQEDLADKMTEECKMAFWQRKELAEKLVPVVDGDMRPSVIADLQADMAAMQGAVALCNAALDALVPVPAAKPSAK